MMKRKGFLKWFGLGGVLALPISASAGVLKQYGSKFYKEFNYSSGSHASFNYLSYNGKYSNVNGCRIMHDAVLQSIIVDYATLGSDSAKIFVIEIRKNDCAKPILKLQVNKPGQKFDNLNLVFNNTDWVQVYCDGRQVGHPQVSCEFAHINKDY